MVKRYFLMILFFIMVAMALTSCIHSKKNLDKNTDKNETRQVLSRNDLIKPGLISIGDPVYSLDDKFIFFSGRYDKEDSIFRIHSDGTNLKKLTGPFGSADFAPIILSNKKVLFSSYRHRTSCADLCIMNMDGENPAWISENGTGGDSKDSSPDGKTFFFASPCLKGDFSEHQYNTADIYAMESDGTNRRKITDFKDFFIRHLSVSPDGKFLLFRRQSFKRYPMEESMWILQLNGKKQYYPLKPDILKFLSNYRTLIIKNKEHWHEAYSNMNYPDLSPDGNSVVFVWPGHYQGYYGHELYLMEIKSKSIQKLTDLREFIVAPAFSNDGKKIIFTVETDYKRSKQNHFELREINIETRGVKKINISY